VKFEHAPQTSYEDVGGGQVLHSAPGFPGFPARLAVELFERARVLVGRERVGLWDPMCGAGGILTSVALLRRDALTRVLASDVDEGALGLAQKNLLLATGDGLEARRAELVARGAAAARVASADRLLRRVAGTPPLPTSVCRADVTDPGSVAALDLAGVDVVMADLPYGTQTDWSSASSAPTARALEVLDGALPPGAVVVLSTTEREHLRGLPDATRSFKHGHRLVRLYQTGSRPR
jgi:hypothetical protein